MNTAGGQPRTRLAELSWILTLHLVSALRHGSQHQYRYRSAQEPACRATGRPSFQRRRDLAHDRPRARRRSCCLRFNSAHEQQGWHGRQAASRYALTSTIAKLERQRVEEGRHLEQRSTERSSSWGQSKQEGVPPTLQILSTVPHPLLHIALLDSSTRTGFNDTPSAVHRSLFSKALRAALRAVGRHGRRLAPLTTRASPKSKANATLLRLRQSTRTRSSRECLVFLFGSLQRF